MPLGRHAMLESPSVPASQAPWLLCGLHVDSILGSTHFLKPLLAPQQRPRIILLMIATTVQETHPLVVITWLAAFRPALGTRLVLVGSQSPVRLSLEQLPTSLTMFSQ